MILTNHRVPHPSTSGFTQAPAPRAGRRHESMGKAPAVIIIARWASISLLVSARLLTMHRHGARLDAEDKQWAPTSATPYDTPLTYGGWTQTRALGARIASLLHARELAFSGALDGDPSKRRSSDTSTHSASSSTSGRRKRQRVVIHSSPFLRCVQSSIAISAGMAQYKGNLQKFEALDAQAHAQERPAKLFHSKRSQTLGAQDRQSCTSSDDSSVPPSEKARVSEESMPDIVKPTLRIDAFLGEWLSNDYFEDIIPPPSSHTMLERAKGELLKNADSIQGARLDTLLGTPQIYPADSNKTPQAESEKMFSFGEMAQTLPAVTNGSSGPTGKIRQPKASVLGYSPPTPLYAIAPGEPIPAGYVAHARDACTDIDMCWDSMDSPQRWGDGGSLGEEWSSMHTRFRSGIKNMIDWYKTRGTEFDPQSGDVDESQGSEDDAEVIMILVTHGAGCNALIGALTNQPVLLDVGMASLTMAVRKPPCADKTPASSPPPHIQSMRRRSPGPQAAFRRVSVDLGLSSEYDMRLIASSEHLRAGADPLKIPQLSVSTLTSMPTTDRARRDSNTSIVSSPMEMERARPKNSSLGSIRRSNVKSFSSRSYTPRTETGASSGLWGSQRQSTADSTDQPPSPTSNMLPDFDNAVTTATPSSASRSASGMWNRETQGELQRGGRSGLWGSRAASGTESRRSTLSERA